MAGWPWPLDGVQRWFESLWNWIQTAARNAVAVVSDWVWTAIRWLKDRLSEAVGWVWSQIKPLLGPIAGWIEKAASLVAKTMLDFARDPIGFIRKSVDWIGDMLGKAWNSLAAGVNAVGSAITRGLDLAKQAIVSGVHNVYAGLTGVISEVGNRLATAFNGAVSALGSWISEALAGVAKALGEALAGFLTWITEKLRWLAQSIIGVALAIKDAVVGFFEMVARGLIGLITSIFRPGSPEKMIQKEAETAFKTMFTELEQLTKIERRSTVPYEALLTAIVSVVARFLILKIGVEAVGAAVDAAHPVKGLKAHEIAAGIMGILDMPAIIGPILAEPVKQGIFIPWSQYWASRYTPQVPGSGDLITFVVREVITPAEFTANMALHGFSRFWSDAYWEAHWVLPARMELVEAFHRGVISQAELDRFMVWHDYKPTPRPGIGKSDLAILAGIRKELIPRVDLRRAWEFGAIGDEELERRYAMLGYEDDAPLMAEIAKRVAMEAEIGRLRDNAKLDFVKGYINEADLRTTLKTLGFGPATIEYHVQDALQDRERKRKDLLVDNYLDAYMKGLIATEAELADRLDDLIVDPELVTEMVFDAFIRRYKTPRAGRVE